MIPIVEDLSDSIKYGELRQPLQEIVGKRYYVERVTGRWIYIYKKSFRLIPLFSARSESASIYAIDETGYGHIVVNDSKLFSLLKKYGEEKGYPKITRDFK